MSRRNLWTEPELDILRSRYRCDSESAKAISKCIGRSVPAIYYMAKRMGIVRKIRGKPWTKQEEEQLGGLITKYSVETVTKIMHRSPSSIINKARRLHFLLSARDGWYTKQEAAMILGVSTSWVTSRICSGQLPATRHNGHKCPDSSRATWHIAEKDLVAFIRKYPDELTGRIVEMITFVDILAGVL